MGALVSQHVYLIAEAQPPQRDEWLGECNGLLRVISVERSLRPRRSGMQAKLEKLGASRTA